MFQLQLSEKTVKWAIGEKSSNRNISLLFFFCMIIHRAWERRKRRKKKIITIEPLENFSVENNVDHGKMVSQLVIEKLPEMAHGVYAPKILEPAPLLPTEGPKELKRAIESGYKTNIHLSYFNLGNVCRYRTYNVKSETAKGELLEDSKRYFNKSSKCIKDSSGSDKRSMKRRITFIVGKFSQSDIFIIY